MWGPGKPHVAAPSSVIIEADTAGICGADLPVRVSCLFRDKQIVKYKELIGCARYSNPVNPVKGKNVEHELTGTDLTRFDGGRS